MICTVHDELVRERILKSYLFTPLAADYRGVGNMAGYILSQSEAQKIEVIISINTVITGFPYRSASCRSLELAAPGPRRALILCAIKPVGRISYFFSVVFD